MYDCFSMCRSCYSGKKAPITKNQPLHVDGYAEQKRKVCERVCVGIRVCFVSVWVDDVCVYFVEYDWERC